MFSHRVTIFKLFGFPVRLDPSWLLLAVFLTWSLAAGWFPSEIPGMLQSTYWWMGLVSTLGLFASIVVHEFAHSLVARRYGLPMKGITLFVFGGVAEMGDEPRDPRVEFRMAAAGPLTSIVLGVLLHFLYLLEQGHGLSASVAVIGYLAGINLLLAAFNLIPAFPLDGGRMLRAALWRRSGDLTSATRRASFIGSGFAIGLMALSVWPLLQGNLIQAMWWFLIGMFLRNAAQSSYQSLRIRSTLGGEPVSRFMNPAPVAVPSNLSLQDLVDEFIFRHNHKVFPVVAPNHALAGRVGVDQVKSVPRDEWARHTVSEVMERRSPTNTIGPNADAAGTLEKMTQSGITRMMVADGDRLVGVIALRDLLHRLLLKLEMEDAGMPDMFHPAHH